MESVRFPGESDQYRQAREELLQAELDLRRRVEAVAALRRRLPVGGVVPQDYVFEELAPDGGEKAGVRKVALSELFGPPRETLILYSFMYGPEMEEPCPMCTSLLDGFDGTAPHLQQQVNLAVVAKSPIQRIRSFARSRGWRNLRLLSSAKNTYNRDYHGESPEGDQNALINVFVRRAGKVHHFYASETLWADTEPGQDPRHVDLFWPLWNLLDLTPGGRGSDWYPELSYDR
jgi:predicted dithiol-disulfide oxidoreductase (DUF899 family)